MSTDGDFAALLLENDRRYFRAGARIETQDDISIVCLDGLQHLAAGCIVEGGREISRKLPTILSRLAKNNAKHLRFYVDGDVRIASLEKAGLERVIEVGMLLASSTAAFDMPAGVSVRPATVHDDPIKLAIFLSDGAMPDGKAGTPADYVALERHKIDAGYMLGFLLIADSIPVATFSLSREDDLLRVKNVYVAAPYRRHGFARAIVVFAHQYARQEGLAAVGVLAFPNSRGHRVYKRIGMREIVAQTEYSAPLAHFARREHEFVGE